MARPYRRLILLSAAVVGAILLLVVGAVLALVLFVDADQFRPRIERVAGTALGRAVSLGRLEWDPGWRIALASSGGSVANAPGFAGADLARWRRIEFGLALRPLLRREAQVDRLVVEGLMLDLQRNADGSANWELSRPGGGGSSGKVRFSVRELALRDGQVRYRDAAKGHDQLIEAINFGAGLPADLRAPILEFSKVSLEARYRDWPVRLNADPVRVTAASQQFELPRFEAQVDETSISGSATGRGGDAPTAESQLRVAMPSLRRQLERAGNPLPPMRDAGVPGPVSLEARASYADGAIRVEELRAKVDDTTLTGRIEVPSIEPLALRFEMQADRVQLDRYMEPDDAGGKPFELPVAQLKALDASGVLSIAEAEGFGGVARQTTITVE